MQSKELANVGEKEIGRFLLFTQALKLSRKSMLIGLM
jgi:hypothetical protein